MSRFMMQYFGKVRPLSFGIEAKSRPVFESERTSWAGIPFEVHDLPPCDGAWEGEPLPGERGITVIIEGMRTWYFDKRQLRSAPGMMTFADGDRHLPLTRATGQARAVVFQLPTLYHERMVADGGPESFAQLPPIPATDTARNLALAIYAEAADGARSGSAYARSLSDALIHYTLEWLPPKPTRVHGGFSEGQRRNLLRYIDAHLDKALSLDEIAAQAGLRPRHFSTLFRNAFGATPHRFLIERRLERAAQLLTTSRLPLTEIALHVGFASHSHFAAAFRRHYGVSPGRYASTR